MESNLYVRYVCSLTHDLIFYEISIWISCDNNFPTCGKFSSPLVARSAARPTVSVILPAATQLPYPSTLRSPIPMPHPTLVSCYRFLPLPPFSCSHSYTLSFSLSLLYPTSLCLSFHSSLLFSLTVFYLSLLFLFCLSFSHSFLFPRSHHLSIYPSIHLSHPRPPSTYLQTLGDPTLLSFPFILRVSLTLNFPIYLFTPPSRTLRVAR